MSKSQNLIASFFQAPLSQQINVLSLTFLFSSISVLVIPIAILFKEPLIFCSDSTNNQFICPEIEACKSEYPFRIDKENGPQSMSAQYELICDNSSPKLLALTCFFFGNLLAAVLQTIFFLDAKKRKTHIVLGIFSLSLFLFLMLVVDILEMDFSLMPWLFFISGVVAIFINTYSYMWVSEYLNGDMANCAILLMNGIWGLYGMIFALLAYYFNTNWKIIISSGCVLAFLPGIFFFLNKSEKQKKELQKNNDKEEEDEEETIDANISILSYWKDMWPNIAIRKNFLIYTFVWGIFCVIYNVQYVEIESVGGSIYFNTIFCSFIDIFSSFVALYLTNKYTSEQILNTSVLIEAVVFLVFILAPVSISLAKGFLIILFVICLLISKFCNDFINLMIYLSLPKMFTDKYAGFFVIVSKSSARILTIFMPILNYYIKMFSFHPFVFYGIVLVICRLLLSYCKIVQDDGIDNLMNDAKISIMEKVAVVSASRSSAGSMIHDDILKNIKVNGVPLSVIRKLKQSQKSMKLNSTGSVLNKSLLKNNNVEKNKSTIEKGDFYELMQI